jgi:FkbM family methyltransferase
MLSIEVWSPKGNPAILYHREDTSDLSTIGSTWNLWGTLRDEYELQWLPPLTGTAIDIGAHVGSVAFALLADHPDLRVVAVEPLADNCAVMATTSEANGWTDRLEIIHGGIGKGKTVEIAYDFAGDDYLRNHRYIGGMALGTTTEHQTETVTALRLRDLVPEAGSPFLKVDCEGCEWALLADPAVAKVERIVGEGHPRDWLKRVHKALDATHDINVIDDREGPGTFSAIRR